VLLSFLFAPGEKPLFKLVGLQLFEVGSALISYQFGRPTFLAEGLCNGFQSCLPRVGGKWLQD